jgi:sorbitol-specific phosphotransferase system component IIC
MAARDVEDNVDAKRDGRDETVAERADRNFSELLQELRVAQTGVQILFAFLVTLPFTQRFGAVTAAQKTLYLATLITAALSMACLIAPVSTHRILFARRQKPRIVQVGNRYAHAGLALLFLAVIGALFLIVDVVAGLTAAILTCGGVAVVFVYAWYVRPLLDRRRST